MIDDQGIEKTRSMLMKIVDVVNEGSDGDVALGASALSLAVHFFCLASGYEHVAFIKNLNHLKDRDNEPTNLTTDEV